MQIRTGATTYEDEAKQLDRRQAITEQLLKSALADKANGEMVSGHYVGNGLGNAIGDIANALISKHSQGGIDESRAALGDRKTAGLQSDLAAYMDTANGKTAERIPTDPRDVEALMQSDQPLPDERMTDAVAADPRTAAVKAVASQFPQVQALGQADLLAMQKAKIPKQEEYGTTAQEFLGANGKTGLMQLGKYGGQKVIDGVQAIEKKPLVTVNTGEKADQAFNSEMIKTVVPNLQKGKDEAEKAVGTFQYLAALKPNLDEAMTGFASDQRLALSKVWQALGGTPDPSISTTEQLNSALAQKLLESTKLLGSGSGFTDKDREYLEKVVQGKLSLDPETIKHAVNSGLADSLNKMYGHQGAVEKSKQVPGFNTNPQALDVFKVDIPKFEGSTIGGDSFDYDEQAKKFFAKPFSRKAQPATVAPAQNRRSTDAPAKVMSAEDYLKAKGF